MTRDLKHRAAFESHGETHVRTLAHRGGEIGIEAKAWLEEQQVLREIEAASRRDAREEETLAIARKALALSEKADHRATVAIVVAASATIAAAIIGAAFS